MCKECGCGEVEHSDKQKVIPIGRDILAENSKYAMHNREHLEGIGVVMFNIVGSPGSGKTSLLERTIPELREKFRIAVIEGDLETANDKDRIDALEVDCYQINTHGVCHLDAKMVHHALHELGVDENFDIIFVENVGNLVCPADFPLGEDFRIVVMSTPEGDDKPEKYPIIFHGSDAVVLNKIDLAPHLEFDIERCRQNSYRTNPKAKFFQLSAKTGEGFEKWLEWVRWAAKSPGR